jgi:hypothetical protein
MNEVPCAPRVSACMGVEMRSEVDGLSERESASGAGYIDERNQRARQKDGASDGSRNVSITYLAGKEIEFSRSMRPPYSSTPVPQKAEAFKSTGFIIRQSHPADMFLSIHGIRSRAGRCGCNGQ